MFKKNYVHSCTYQYISVHTSIYQYILVCTVTSDIDICSYRSTVLWFFSIDAHMSNAQYMTYSSPKQQNTEYPVFMKYYVHRCTYWYKSVHPSIYQYIQVCTTLHFKSGEICLAMLTSLSWTLVPVNAGRLLPVFSVFNWQTTQARLATSKLPQPRVNLIDIAATPAVHCCCISAAHRETSILALAVQMRDCWGWVSSQKQGHKGDSANHVLCWSHIQTRCRGWFVQLDHPRVLHRSLDWQIQLLKGAEEYKLAQEIIWYEKVKKSIYNDIPAYTSIY